MFRFQLYLGESGKGRPIRISCLHAIGSQRHHVGRTSGSGAQAGLLVKVPCVGLMLVFQLPVHGSVGN